MEQTYYVPPTEAMLDTPFASDGRLIAGLAAFEQDDCLEALRKYVPEQSLLCLETMVTRSARRSSEQIDWPI
jgi:hypothetical protein